MKATRRILTLALAMLLVFALSITAFAAADPADGKGGTIKVEGAVLADPANYTVYTVYKIFDVLDGLNPDENKYRATAQWVDFVKQTALEPYFKVQDTTDGVFVVWLKNTNSAADAAVIAQLAREYTEANTLTNVGTATVNGAALPVEDDGYYLLVPNNTTASGVVVVKDEEEKVVTEKSVAPGMPTVEKKVLEDSTSGYQDSNSADIGQTVTYRTTIVAGVGASNYILHDAMDEHIELDVDSFSVTRGGNPVPQKTGSQDGEYEVITSGICAGCTFHIKFEEDWCNSLQDGAKIVVNYNGVLLHENGANKTNTDEDHTNTAWLTHTAKNVETDRETVATQTYQIDVKKVDQAGNALKNAGFKLRDNEHRFYKFDETTKTVSWVDEANATEYFSDENGLLSFYGVDAAVYYLKETSVPGGYTGDEETLADARNGSLKDAKIVVIENQLGTKLPETGGIGTTVFYIGGAVLVLGALAAMVVIKRKEG